MIIIFCKTEEQSVDSFYGKRYTIRKETTRKANISSQKEDEKTVEKRRKADKTK